MQGALLRPPQSSLPDLTGAFQARRAQLRKVVKIVMIVCVAIFFLAGARAAVGAIVGDSSQSAPHAREAMTSELGAHAPVRTAEPVHTLPRAKEIAKQRAPRNRWKKWH